MYKGTKDYNIMLCYVSRNKDNISIPLFESHKWIVRKQIPVTN